MIIEGDHSLSSQTYTLVCLYIRQTKRPVANIKVSPGGVLPVTQKLIKRGEYISTYCLCLQ